MKREEEREIRDKFRPYIHSIGDLCEEFSKYIERPSEEDKEGQPRDAEEERYAGLHLHHVVVDVSYSMCL